MRQAFLNCKKLQKKTTKIVIVALEIIFTTKLRKCNCKEMITNREKEFND